MKTYDEALAEACEKVAQGYVYPMPPAGVTYSIALNGKAIMCWTCGKVSHNYEDVNLKYCGFCHKFHVH